VDVSFYIIMSDTDQPIEPSTGDNNDDGALQQYDEDSAAVVGDGEGNHHQPSADEGMGLQFPPLIGYHVLPSMYHQGATAVVHHHPPPAIYYHIMPVYGEYG
jgi:hypothetical protein